MDGPGTQDVPGLGHGVSYQRAEMLANGLPSWRIASEERVNLGGASCARLLVHARGRPVPCGATPRGLPSCRPLSHARGKTGGEPWRRGHCPRQLSYLFTAWRTGMIACPGVAMPPKRLRLYHTCGTLTPASK